MSLDLYARIARHAALREPDLLLEALSTAAGEPEDIAEMLRRHHLLGLVCSVATQDPVRAPRSSIVEALASRQPIPRVPVEALIETYREIRRALEARGLPLMLLKGFYFADRLYGGLDRRPQYDIDLLIRRKDLRAALKVFGELGFVRKSRDFHSHTLAREAIHVDLHHSPRRSPAYSFDEAAVWRRARDARAGDLAFRTLSDEDYVTMLATSIFEDVGFGKGNLKQALDLYLLLRKNDPRRDWEAYFRDTPPRPLLGVVANVLALVADVFAAEGELAQLSASLERRKGLIDHADRDQALRLLFAPRGRVENMLWFGRIYPGSVLYYRGRFWLWTFPANLRNLDADWFRRNAAYLLHRWSSR